MAKGLFAKKEEARRLRREDGLSINEIVKRLSAVKSTVSLWVRDIELTESQKDVLREKNPAYSRTVGREAAMRSCVKTWANRRRGYQEEGRKRARDRNVDFIAGCMLYWAEGSKSRNAVRFTNTDENMMRFFVKFLRDSFQIRDEDVRVTVRFYTKSGLSVEEVQEHWGGVIGLPYSSFCKAEVDYDKRLTSGQKIKHPYGVCAVQVNNVRIVQFIYGAIQEYAGFSSDELLG